MSKTERSQLIDRYERAYSDRVKDSAEAFGQRPDVVHFTQEGDAVHLDVTFKIPEQFGSYPSAEDVRDHYSEELQALAGVWDDRRGSVKLIAWSPDMATARACDIPNPAED